ncbi:IS3 family transposase [Pyramidobacter sp. SM-530-WT-4B]|uniref:IS3 family transposase n=1 Tax=Pyramidobacter porci TaxID=2605789 RepID=A0A6L5YCF5_9BACT|nr:IS3 family transposase [Pyramidobacter porci]
MRCIMAVRKNIHPLRLSQRPLKITSTAIKNYIHYYNKERIQIKTKWMPPVKYRIASISRSSEQ